MNLYFSSLLFFKKNFTEFVSFVVLYQSTDERKFKVSRHFRCMFFFLSLSFCFHFQSTKILVFFIYGIYVNGNETSSPMTTKQKITSDKWIAVERNPKN